MTDLIREQMFQFLIMFYGGIAFMIFFEVYSGYRSVGKKKKWVVIVQDILFWVFIALIISFFLYYASYGDINVHETLGFFSAIILWRVLLYGKIIRAVQLTYAIIKKSVGGRKVHAKEKKKVKKGKEFDKPSGGY